jgi:hypothetical protein
MAWAVRTDLGLNPDENEKLGVAGPFSSIRMKRKKGRGGVSGEMAGDALTQRVVNFNTQSPSYH